MKKVISALTVAAMCASMSASVMPAFAINAADAEFYLKAAKADKGTISADGATITFASAADAKGAKITIQEFIKADTAEPYVQQILSGFRVKDGVKSIKLGEAGVDYNATVGDEKTYKIGDAEIDTDMFVSCFSTIDEFDEFDANVKQFMWGHSDNWGWKDTYKGGDTLNLIWAQPNGAKFNSDKTDTYPFTEFYATIGDDIKDGTYTIEIFDTWDNLGNTSEKNPTGTVDGSTISDGKTTTKVTKTKNLTIVVGDAAATEKPTEATQKPTEKPTEKPTDATEKPTEKPTETSTGKQSLDDKKNSKEWTWYFDDVTYDPAADTKKLGAAITAYVTKDQGTYGYEFTPLINGKSLKDAGWTIKRAKQDKNGYNFSSFDTNMENGHLGGASQSKDGDTTLPDGTPVVVLNLLPGENVKDGVYKVSFKDLTVGNFKDVKSNPASIAGSITIGNPPTTDKPTEKPTDATDKPTDKPTEKPTDKTTDPTTTPVGDYLYGDVNEDGKVELIDVVKLNRFITGVDKELSAKAKEQGNCYRLKADEATLDGSDSVEILRYLIGLVTKLSAEPQSK
jgi:cell division septation protein DedD